MKASELIKKLELYITEYGDRDVLLENNCDCKIDSEVEGLFIGWPTETLSGAKNGEVCFYIEGNLG